MRPDISPKELSQAINRSESSIKRWVDEGKIKAEKTNGGHRRISLHEAIRFIRTNHVDVVDPAIFGISNRVTFKVEKWTSDFQANQFFSFLISRQAELAREYLVYLYLHGLSVAEICDGSVAVAMRRIGEMWRHDKNGICIEHQATDICIDALNVFRSTFHAKPNAPLALGGAPPLDPYILPSTVVATTLLSEGFNTINFGPNTPFQEFNHAIETYRPIVVWLSISHVKKGLKLESEIQKLARTARCYGSHLLVGGREWKKENRSVIPDINTANSMVELVAFLRGLRRNQISDLNNGGLKGVY